MLFNDKAKAVVYYILKYATKAQQDMEPGTMDAVAWFEKKLIAEQRLGASADVGTATRRVLSMAYNASSRQQIPAQLAALHVLGHPGKICSHSFAPLMLAQAMQRFRGDAISGVLRLHRPSSTSGGTAGANGGGAGGRDGEAMRRRGDGDALSASDDCVDRAGSGVDGAARRHEAQSTRAQGGCLGRRRQVVVLDSYTEYACRPAELDDVNWYSYVELFEQVKLPPRYRRHRAAISGGERSAMGLASEDGDRGGADNILEYTGTHPLIETHGVRQRAHRYVPRVFGPRLPDRHENTSDASKETYGMIALILFAPWRQRQDLLLSRAGVWWAAYEAHEFDLSSKAQMDIMQSWYDAKKAADAEAAEDAAAVGAKDDDGGVANGGAEVPQDNCHDGPDSLDPEGGQAVNWAGAMEQEIDDASKPVAASRRSGEPAVARLVATGALRFLQDALCRGVSSFVGSLFSSGGDFVEAGVLQSDEVDGPAGGSGMPCASSALRVSPAIVEKEAAAMCAKVRNGEDMGVVDESSPSRAAGGVGGDGKAPYMSVEALAAALCDVQMPTKAGSRKAGIPEVVPPGLSIGEVGAMFSLNKLQMGAFSLIPLSVGRSMLRDLEAVSADGATPGHLVPPPAPQGVIGGAGRAVSQLLFYLGGEGGTGKTRVIDAVSFFCASWGRPRAVVTAAFTGLAATSIGGSTLHSLVQLAGKGRRAPRMPTAQQRAGFRGTLMVIIDEVSMLSAEQLAETEARLRLLMERDQDFGGLHVVLAGDYFQMPPIGASFLFVDSGAAHVDKVRKQRSRNAALASAARRFIRRSAASVKKAAAVAAAVGSCGCAMVGVESPSDEQRAAGLLGVPGGGCDGTVVEPASGLSGKDPVPLTPRMQKQRRGFHLWRLFESVVMLTENVRQSKDREYQLMVAAARRGEWSEESIARFNTRVVSVDKACEVIAADVAIIVFTNTARTHVTRLLMSAIARRMPRRVLRLFAGVQSRGRALSTLEREVLLSLPSQVTGDLEMVLDLHCGLSILVTKNLATELGVANGSRGVVEGLQFPAGTTFTEVVASGGGVILVPSAPAEIVWIKVAGAVDARRRLPSTPACFGDDMFPVVMSKFSGNVCLGKAAGDASVPLNIAQSPLTPGLVMTPYKVQGRTVEGLCIPTWPGQRCPSCTAYLMLSRPQKLCQLLLLEPLSRSLAALYKPSAALVAENSRLLRLSAATVEACGTLLASVRNGDLWAAVGSDAAVASGAGGACPSTEARCDGEAAVAVGSGISCRPRCEVGQRGAVGSAADVDGCRWRPTADKPRGATASTTVPVLGRRSRRAADLCGVPADTELLKKARGAAMGQASAAIAVADVNSGNDLFAALSVRERLLVDRARDLASGDVGRDVVVRRFEHAGSLTRFDLRTLLPDGWLSSDALFCLFTLLQARNFRVAAVNPEVRRCLFMSPYFYQAIAGGLFRQDPSTSVAHLHGQNVFDYRLLFVPINEGNGHWYLAVINPAALVVELYDSKGGASRRAALRTGGWLRYESNRCGRAVGARRVKYVYHEDRSPQQVGDDDCGVFTAVTARQLGDGAPLSFGQGCMSRARERFSFELVVG